MKRTDLEKRERELRRKEKKMETQARKSASGAGNSPGYYIDTLFSKFLYDKNEIFNTETDIAILEVLEEMKNDLPEKHWEIVLKKSIKKAGVQQKDKAFNELCDLMKD